MRIVKMRMLVSILGLSMIACTSPEIEKSHEVFPLSKNETVAVFAFKNYTETPLAGKRAASLAEGVLSAKGYSSSNNVDSQVTRRVEMCRQARYHHIDYVLTGGVSEWRYKTGIDGEPAVSFSLKLLRSSTCTPVWSGTASDNDWGNASIGTTAQNLMTQILQ